MSKACPAAACAAASVKGRRNTDTKTANACNLISPASSAAGAPAVHKTRPPARPPPRARRHPPPAPPPRPRARCSGARHCLVVGAKRVSTEGCMAHCLSSCTLQAITIHLQKQALAHSPRRLVCCQVCYPLRGAAVRARHCQVAPLFQARQQRYEPVKLALCACWKWRRELAPAVTLRH